MDNRFKVGDKVQVSKVSGNTTWYRVGDIFTIVEVDTEHPWSEMLYKGMKNGLHIELWLRNDDIVAYKKETKKPAKYHIGQKVRLKETFGSLDKGDITEITFVDKNDDTIPVKIRLSDGYDAWIDASRFEVVESHYPVIVITTDGRKTSARLIDGKETIYEASAKLSDKDTFDFETGAMIAFDRLVKTMGANMEK